MLKRTAGLLTLLFAFAKSGALAAETSFDGTLVDVARYVSGNQNAVLLSGMSAMHAMMHEGMMSPHAASTHQPMGNMMGGGPSGMMGAQGMSACMSSLGLLMKDGTTYLLVAKRGTATEPLCGKVGSHAVISGTEMEKGGLHAILVDTLRVTLSHQAAMLNVSGASGSWRSRMNFGSFKSGVGKAALPGSGVRR